MMEPTHALSRTSPKGQPFVGTCYRCGQKGLPIDAASQPCINTANLSDSEAVLMAVTGEPQ